MGSNLPPTTSNNPLKACNDTCEIMTGLYVTLHDFDCPQQHVLTFQKGQIVEVTKASSSANWHRGRVNGKTGFLPANGYLQKIKISSCKWVVRQEFAGSVPGQLRISEGQVVTVIAKHDVHWWSVLADSGKWGQVPAKFLKLMSSTAGEGEGTAHKVNHVSSEPPDVDISRPAPLPRTQSQHVVPQPDLSPPPRSSTISRTSGQSSPNLSRAPKRRDVVKISSSLVEGVRRTGVKYQTSKDIVQTVLEKLGEEYPEWNTELSGLCRALTRESDLQSNSVDSLKLEQLFEHLMVLTEDEQQRGWSCKDDTAEISTMFSDLFLLLKNANPKVVMHVLKTLKYEPLLTLVQYYQLEKRTGLKRQALDVMYESMMIQPDPVCSILLTSRLPVQLAYDLQSTRVMRLLEQQCSVFTTCLSYPSNTMPRNHYDQLDEDFIAHLLRQIEHQDIPYDPEHLIPHLFLRCVLSLNLHYTDVTHNKVCKVLKGRRHATHLTELLVVAFNRAENLPGHYSSSVDSVKKLMLDLFSSPDTAQLFFTNDLKVLIEVLHRNVIDRAEGDKDRGYYLRLLDRLIRNTEYSDHRHYSYEIVLLLKQIIDEESTDTESKRISEEILVSLVS